MDCRLGTITKKKYWILVYDLKNTFKTEFMRKIEALPTITEETSREVNFVIPNEIIDKIKTNRNPRKVTGYDLITGQILKQLPGKTILKLTNILYLMQFLG